MCGRITQYRGRHRYADEIGWQLDPAHVQDPDPWGPDDIRHYNVSPGICPDVMHTLKGDRPDFDNVHWGYWPRWAKEKGLPMSINARVEGAATKPYFRHMFRQGRVIVPADGWYEWTGAKGHKQPWYIRLADDKPIFLAAITNFRPSTSQEKEAGFVILTAAAEGGLVDVHDRRPVVLASEDARMWMNNEMPAEEAEDLARNHALPPDAFEWYKVSTEVNSVKNNNAHLIEPI